MHFFNHCYSQHVSASGRRNMLGNNSKKSALVVEFTHVWKHVLCCEISGFQAMLMNA
jgi:hypothetical protein